uniref:Small ribosomal subunit protein bS1c n=1 Tax=Leiomenia cribrosa TaxID=217483 RepID=A0A4D6WW61_9FLOR|nr:ribosomal protein S1 [Leiomenia cribrosa]
MQKKKNFTSYDFESVLTQYNYNIHTGDIVAGTIFSQEFQGFLVDIGANIAGYLPVEEIKLSENQNYHDIFSLNNETREFFIIAYNKKLNLLLLSIKRLEYIRSWKRIKQLESEDVLMSIKIEKINKGGIITFIEGLQGFIPKSHLNIKLHDAYQTKSSVKCKILIANEKINKLILSNKKAILDNSNKKFKIGEIVHGKIIKIEKYGAFIKIYGISALLHISEIGNNKIEDINQIFHIGDYIKVKILHIDTERARLYVSRRNINID